VVPRIERNSDRLSVLLLADGRRGHAPNVLEHVRALQRFSRHRVDLFNPRGARPSRRLRLSNYDVVAVHYTVFVLYETYLPGWVSEQLIDFDGLKVQFLQDEYRQVDAITARMRELGIGLLFSSIPSDAVPLVYGSRLPGVDILPTLAGYVPAELQRRPPKPSAGRPLDVVYRGRSVPYWLGRLGQDKVLIGREFLARASSTDLRCDISWTESDRIYGENWYRFLSRARSTLGTESGASIVDFDGSLHERTDAYLAAHPDASFDDVDRDILAPYEGNAVIDAVSPRVFEAAALGTAMVNFTGRYSGVIEPWVHYVPLEKDFSNFDEVVGAIRDDALLNRIAEHAHADLVASGRYSLRGFVQAFDQELEARAQPRRRRPRSPLARAAEQTLLALEELRAPARWAELPPVARLRARAVDHAGRRLIQRFPAIEALARNGHSDRLLHDLVRLAAAAAAHTRELSYDGPPFDVRLELDALGRRLTLVSTAEPTQDASERSQLRARVATAAREGRLEEIVWNHRAVGVALGLVSIPPTSLEIGYHVVKGAHRFAALGELARSEPDRLLAALEPLFRPRPAAPMHELHGPMASVSRLLSSPERLTARRAAALRAVVTSKELRRLLRAYLRSSEARAETPLDLLLRDLFRLTLVRRSRTRLELDTERKALIYRTSVGSSQGGVTLEPATVQSLELIVWDRSAEDAVYEFEALAAVARRFPQLAAPALRQAVAG
jgi:hypothetical protein